MHIYYMNVYVVFWRRGYYKPGHEDHRWEFVQKRFTSKLQLHIFNFVFMGFVQNWILLGYTLPLWFIQTHKVSPRGAQLQEPMNAFDWLMAGVFLLGLGLEVLADEQQWRFQSRKYKWLGEQRAAGNTNAKSGEFSDEEIKDFRRGFNCKGLFAYSRHPNYVGDMILWWAIYGFTLSSQAGSTGGFGVADLFNYSLASALVMTLLFQRSVAVTEKISASKYPEYEDYKAKIGRIWPSFTPYVPKNGKD